MNNQLKQFKLLSGDEIICEVVEWPDVEDEFADIIVRNVYEIKCLYNPTNGYRIHSLRPWYTMQMQEGIFQSINSQHITSEANPVRDLIEHYKQSIEAELESISLTTEEVEKEMTREDLESFDEEENIISFPTKDKMH
jgi:hypothetical protein